MEYCVICNYKTDKSPCPVCQINLENGYYAVIGADDILSTPEIPFRTGEVYWIQAEAIGKLLNTESLAVLATTGFLYADHKMMHLLKHLTSEAPPDKLCTRCGNLTGPASDGGCLYAYDPNCAWHVKN